MKIAYFAPGSYNGLKQRPQHIAELLSINNEIFYIEPTISLIRYLLKHGEKYKSFRFDINKNLHIIKLNGLFTFHKSIEVVDCFKINSISERLQLKDVIKNCDLIWIGYPVWYNVIRWVKNKPIVFDKMDDDIEITSNYFLKRLLRTVEPKLIKKSDVILVTCQEFYDRIAYQKKQTYLIRNGVPIDFKINLKINESERKQEKVFGYIGTVGHWFDMEAIRIILNQDDLNRVVIVGDNAVEKLNHSRISYIDRVDKKLLPEIINKFDVCLYPFKINSFLDTINPVKIYEYLALNKPVIAVSSKETRVLDDKCYLYSNYIELEQRCREILDQPFRSEEELELFIKYNSWEEKVSKIEKIIIKLIKDK